jgi:hypothetical protein
VSLLVGLNFREQLDTRVETELDEMIGALQSGFVNRAQGQDMALLLGLQSPELLDPVVRDELDQVMAAIQTAFNSQTHNIIKSLRYGTITSLQGLSTGTFTWIDPVDVNNTELVLLGQEAWQANQDPDNGLMRIDLTNPTTVTSTRGQLNDNGGKVGFLIREYQPGVLKSAVQRGVITLNAVTSSTSTIIAVDTTRAVLSNLGVQSANAGTDLPATIARLSFTTAGANVLSTTVSATRYSNNGLMYQGFQVVEFY